MHPRICLLMYQTWLSMSDTTIGEVLEFDANDANEERFEDVNDKEKDE